MTISKLFKNPWFISIGCGIFLFLLGQIFEATRTPIWNGISWFFTVETSIKLWIFIILCCVLLIFTTSKFINIRKTSRQKTTDNKPDFLKYRDGEFCGYYWIWNYKEEEGEYKINILNICCPKHKTELVEVIEEWFDCPEDGCDVRYTDSRDHPQFLWKETASLIRRNIREGNYPK